MGAARALEKFGLEGRSSAPALKECIKDSGPWVRCAAIRALGAVCEDTSEFAFPVLHALEDDNCGVRGTAARTLTQFRSIVEMAVPKLIVALKDKEPSVCQTAAESLGLIGRAAAPAIPSLLEISKEGNNLAVKDYSSWQSSVQLKQSCLTALKRIRQRPS
jgi:HEAT repeat protein